MQKFTLLIILLLCCRSYSQTDTLSHNKDGKYAAIDDYARTVKYKNDLGLLSRELTQNYHSDLEKTRAIFIWITDNISYDYKFVNRNKKIKFPKCKKNQDCGTIQKAWEDKFLHKVITRKKSICEGYARLFKRLCDDAGIQGSVVAGYTKQKPGQVGKMGPLSHAWNAVLIDGQFYYFDVTWASGSCARNKKGKLEKFQKGYDDYYWCTPPEKLYRNHFPKDPLWLKDSGYTKERYRDNAYIRGNEMKYLDIIEPESGVLKVKNGDTIRFKIHYTLNLENLEINTNVKEKPEDQKVEDNEDEDIEMEEVESTIPFKRDGDTIEFEYIIDRKSTRYIDVLFDYNRVMRFNVKF
ncbi:transglutaminase domain-containing protein [Flavobacterium sp. DGU11]|uniref:Transglutaminase domain-containing protein n=1 Tax=Flavobacterium arundinis TaxID=3139143 RepID=A0ABU9HWK6_9FLAO